MARPKAILLVDDDNGTLKFVARILENEGFRVTTAHDGETALEKVREAPPDLVLSEILLPHKNGYQVCRAIKEDKVLASLPVVFLSTKSQPSDRFWAKRVGADGFIAKPFDPADLLHEVRSKLGKRKKKQLAKS